MKQCVIFCAAGFDRLACPLTGDEILIAADGGLEHTKKAGLTPDIILGDFDSLGYVPENAEVFPVEKDDTDAMLAVKKGLSLGCGEFLLYGSLDGDRLDHTIANFQTLQYLADHGAQGFLVGLHHIVTVIRNGEITFPEDFTGIVSAFCLGSDAENVCISGLQYALDGGTLTAGFPLGVSNHFIGKKSCIRVEQGSLLVVWDRQNGLPTVSTH